MLAGYFVSDGYTTVEVETWDGSWINRIVLPNGVPDGSKLKIICRSTWSVDISYPDGGWTSNVRTNENPLFKVNYGVWNKVN